MLGPSLYSDLDLKFLGEPASGEFEGYGSVFGNIDDGGDKILPGAFQSSLAEGKASGRGVAMHLNHGISLLGGQRGIGVWHSIAEDAKGLRVKGKISGMNTDAGRLLYERMKDGAYPGMSIGYKLMPNGATYGQRAGEPRRTLKNLHLAEISLVDTPMNSAALVDGIKAAMAAGDTSGAAASIAHAMRMHDKTMSDSYGSVTPRDKAQLMNHLRNAHMALTGSYAPDDLEGWTKSAPITLRELEEVLREKGLTNSQARAVAERGFKSAFSRDEGNDEANDDAAALTDLRSSLSTFSLS